jgi:hypothetical protein
MSYSPFGNFRVICLAWNQNSSNCNEGNNILNVESQDSSISCSSSTEGSSYSESRKGVLFQSFFQDKAGNTDLVEMPMTSRVQSYFQQHL